MAVLEFIIQFLDKFSAVLGDNPLLVTAVGILFVFGIIYALGLPRFISIPFVVFASIIVLNYEVALSPIFSILIGLGVGYFLYLVFGG